MRTEITELLGIQYPIIQGGMAWVAEYHLAAAVSEAGGLGIIGAAAAPGEWVREQIREVKRWTEKPFGVNIMLMSPYADEVARIVVEEDVKVVTTGAGSPEKYMKLWKEAGIRVIPVVASVALAKRMERCGADALVAEGTEAGGHIGENTTMVLVPQIVDAVKVPVIAAGGIADGRGAAAAFMLGAKGIQVGTRFVVTEESQVHEKYKEAILKAKDIDSKVTGRSTGHPVRGLRNQMTQISEARSRRSISGRTGIIDCRRITQGSCRRRCYYGKCNGRSKCGHDTRRAELPGSDRSAYAGNDSSSKTGSRQ